jgi:hypothetical protein
MSNSDKLFSHNGQPGLWLDYFDYAGRLLANGAPPWLSEADVIAWLRKAQGLLRSQVIMLPLDRLCGVWLESHPLLAEAMAKRQRSTFALKTLLADEALRAYLTSLARSLRDSFAETPIVLRCPSPALWIQQAWSAVNDEPLAVGNEDIDSAAVYSADFLRAFGDVGLDALLLQESELTEATDITLYRPLFNVAAHYRWATGLLAPTGQLIEGSESLGFVISPQASGDKGGQYLATDYWQQTDPVAESAAAFRYAQIPADAEPEIVLQRLAALRA